MVDADEARAVRLLERAGLVPGIRHVSAGVIGQVAVPPSALSGGIRWRATMGRAVGHRLQPAGPRAVTRSASHPERLTEEIIPSRSKRVRTVGVTSADVFEETRTVLNERKARDLHGGMAFTYRNPERSTDPGASSRVLGPSWSGPGTTADSKGRLPALPPRMGSTTMAGERRRHQ